MSATKATRKLSIDLGQTDIERRSDDPPLGEVLDKALQVIFPGWAPDPEDRDWLVRTAIRAVSNEIIASGCLPLLVQVSFKR